MAEIKGLSGLRPVAAKISSLCTPPYDVIKKGSPLAFLLNSNPLALTHITLGANPAAVLHSFVKDGILIEDNKSCFYVYEQTWQGGQRFGLLSAVAVDDYSNKNIIRHERTFDYKVEGRVKLARDTGYTFEPIFLLTLSRIQKTLESIPGQFDPVYDFNTDFKRFSDLHDIRSRIFKVPENSPQGRELSEKISQNPLYIADGHHRYHASLVNRQTHTLGYIVQNAQIQAYNRVVKGTRSFAEVRQTLNLIPCESFQTPPKRTFCLYSRAGCFLKNAGRVPDDVLGGLDAAILEKELYPALGITPELAMKETHVDYFPELELGAIKERVNMGDYDIGVALHPVSMQELMAVANAGLNDPAIVMPPKSTFFSPKILSGIILYRHHIFS